MRLLIQRVTQASVQIDSVEKSRIGKGLLLFVGIEATDTEEDIAMLCRKTVNVRIFDDENGVMNKSVMEIGGEILVVSQFTLHASTKNGKPSLLHQIGRTGNINTFIRAILQNVVSLV